MKSIRNSGLLLLLLALPALACGIFSGDDGGPPSNATVLPVMANTSLGPWLEEAVAAFNDAEYESVDGDPIYVELTLTDAGAAVTRLEGGAETALWIPDDPVWVAVLAETGNDAYSGDCSSVARSPLVMALWQPLAESLGWPARDLGWLDIGSLAADPGAWSYYSGGQYGDSLRLGHTHPGLSASGANTLLALVQAAEATAEPVTVAEIEQPVVQASVGAFESAVSWFSSDTASLGREMSERGSGFLGAAVMYESDVVHYGRTEPPLIPIYPFEGTFVATHPACVSGSAGGTAQEAARTFRAYLQESEVQEMAVGAGLRPVADDVDASSLVAYGVDLEAPEVTFASPSVDALFAVQELWQSARKDVNLVMLLDVSGSMAGRKISTMREAAVQFVEQMGDDDYLSIIAFATEPRPVVKYQQLGESRDEIIAAIRSLEAEGDTSLYDAIGDGASLLLDTERPDTSNALVVLTDGLDTFSNRYDQNSAVAALGPTGATVFTIAYGSDADENLLANMALAANGNYYLGDEANITAIYEEMSAAFGGSVGVGR